ncbi:MAG: alkaline phosphatase [Anaerohalosphaeraceae bacterium]
MTINPRTRFFVLALSVLFLLDAGCSTVWHYVAPAETDISFYQPPTAKEPLSNPVGERPKNVILCIGDGMGINQIALARQAAAGADGRLWMERMPYTALVYTHNIRGEVTDSAAGITALMCGIKTRNDRIGQDSKGADWISIAERLQQEGYRIGAVATSTITHATPAGLAAHIHDRNLEAQIAVQLFESRADVLLGGGRKYWLPQPQGVRTDGRNLPAEAEAAGWQVISSKEQLGALSSGRVLGFFASDAMTTLPPEPTLAEMTQAALRILSRTTPPKPFFLLMEGSQIDWCCHANDAKAAVRQTLLFDMAVREALEFAAADKQTLVLVTADHETGGLTLYGGGPKPNWMKSEWSSKNHSNGPVILLAFGPGAEHFTGVLDNTDIPRRIARLLGISDFPKPRRKQSAAAHAALETAALN